MHDNHRARAKLSLEWKEAIKDLCSPTGKRKQQLRFYSGSGIGAFSVLTWSFWKMPENACCTLQVKRQGSWLCWVGCSVATWFDYFLMAWESGTESWVWCTLETISDCGFLPPYSQILQNLSWVSFSGVRSSAFTSGAILTFETRIRMCLLLRTLGEVQKERCSC